MREFYNNRVNDPQSKAWNKTGYMSVFSPRWPLFQQAQYQSYGDSDCNFEPQEIISVFMQTIATLKFLIWNGSPCFYNQLIGGGGGGGGGGASDPNGKLNLPFDASICVVLELFRCIQGGQTGGTGGAASCWFHGYAGLLGCRSIRGRGVEVEEPETPPLNKYHKMHNTTSNL